MCAMCTDWIALQHPRHRFDVTILSMCALCHRMDYRPKRKHLSILRSKTQMDWNEHIRMFSVTVVLVCIQSMRLVSIPKWHLWWFCYARSLEVHIFVFGAIFSFHWLICSHPISHRILSLSLPISHSSLPFRPKRSKCNKYTLPKHQWHWLRRASDEFEHNVYLYWLSSHLVHFRLRYSINVLNKNRY